MSGPREYFTVTLSARELAVCRLGLRLAAVSLTDHAYAEEAQGAPDDQVLSLRDSAGIAEDLRERLTKIERS